MFRTTFAAAILCAHSGSLAQTGGPSSPPSTTLRVVTQNSPTPGQLATVLLIPQDHEAEPITISPPDASVHFAHDATALEDISGDGYPDVLVSDPLAGIETTSVGALHMFDGATGERLYTLSGPSDVTLSNEYYPIRDADGDGVNDLFVRTHTLDANHVLRDSYYLFSGATGITIGHGRDPHKSWSRRRLWHARTLIEPPSFDLNHDGLIDVQDLVELAAYLSQSVTIGSRFDLVIDGMVDHRDVSALINAILLNPGVTAASFDAATAQMYPFNTLATASACPDPGTMALASQMPVYGGITPTTIEPDGTTQSVVTCPGDPPGGGCTVDNDFETLEYENTATGGLQYQAVLFHAEATNWKITSGEDLLETHAFSGNSFTYTPRLGARGTLSFTVFFKDGTCNATLKGSVEIIGCAEFELTAPATMFFGSVSPLEFTATPAGGIESWAILSGHESASLVQNESGWELHSLGIAGPVVLELTYTTGPDCTDATTTVVQVIPEPGVDSDDDGLSDECESDIGTDALDPNDSAGASTNDSDNDGLSDFEECLAETDPHDFDSDDDGIPDGDEIDIGSDPNNPDTDDDGTDDTHEDCDGDGLSDFEEIQRGTDPCDPDTDNDSTDDGTEVDQGSDPKDASDGGEAPPPDALTTLGITVGDPSGSHSEHWALEIENVISVRAPGHGQVTDPPVEVTLRRGESYTVTVKHLGSLYSAADYDYTAQITPEDPSIVILDDPDSLLGSHGTNGTTGSNHAEGLSATIYLPLLDLDIDSDNDDSFDQPSRSRDENDAEDVPGTNGKLLFVNDDDIDEDGIPDYADGFDLRSEDPDDNESLGDDFAPLVLELHALPDSHNTKIIFEYEASDPLASEVVHIPHATYVALPEEGALRIWTKPPDESRFGSGLSTGGNFIESGEEYTLSQLGYVDDEPLTLWVEAVQPSYEPGDLWINASIKGMDGDTVRLTACKPEFVTWDEESGEEFPVLPLIQESNPRPTVDLNLESAVFDAEKNLTIHFNWSVRDQLSDIIDDPLYRVQSVTFSINGNTIHTEELDTATATTGTMPWQPSHFLVTGSTTLTIPPPSPNTSTPEEQGRWSGGPIILNAKTSPNAAGRVGWDTSAIKTYWKEGNHPGAIEITSLGDNVNHDDSVGNTYSLINAGTINLAGSSPGNFSPIVFRLPVISQNTAESLSVEINEIKQVLNPFTFSPEKYYIVKEDGHGKPRVLLITLDRLPDDLDAIKPDNIDYQFEGQSNWRIKDDNSIYLKDYTVEVVPSDITDIYGENTPRDEPITEAEVFAAYLMLYGEIGQTLLHYYQQSGSEINVERANRNHAIVKHYTIASNKVHIRVDNRNDPFKAAEHLYAGLRQSLAYWTVRNQVGTDMNSDEEFELYKDMLHAQAEAAIEIAVTGTQLYLYGAMAFTGPTGDLVFVLNDLADGNWRGAGVNLAFALVPFIPAGTSSVTNVTFKSSINGPDLFIITPALKRALDTARRANATIAEKYAAIANNTTVSERLAIIRGGNGWKVLTDGTARRRAAAWKTAEGFPRPTSNHHIHHDFPIQFQDWFLAHGIDINEPAFTRWIHKDGHLGLLHSKKPPYNHSRGGAWNAEWQRFKDAEDAGSIGYTRDEVISKLDELRSKDIFLLD